MAPARHYLELKCSRCGRRDLLDLVESLGRLRELGMLKRAEQPTWDVILELLVAVRDRLICGRCGAAGLQVGPYEEHADVWDERPACSDCGRPIEPERLELFPGASRCAACQRQQEAGRAEPEFCPRCGEIMQLRAVAASVTRYRLRCPRGC